jgi:hypothetical protein
MHNLKKECQKQKQKEKQARHPPLLFLAKFFWAQWLEGVRRSVSELAHRQAARREQLETRHSQLLTNCMITRQP